MFPWVSTGAELSKMLKEYDMGSSGSPRHTEKQGPGPVAGAGEQMTAHNGPGRTVKGVSMNRESYPNRKTPGPPSGVKMEDEGE